MEWSTDTTKCEHDKDYLVYYDEFYNSHDIQLYKNMGIVTPNLLVRVFMLWIRTMIIGRKALNNQLTLEN